MDGETIRKLIDENNKKISAMITPATFVLHPEIGQLLSENKKLQKQCPQEFTEKGYCKYCDAMEVK